MKLQIGAAGLAVAASVFAGCSGGNVVLTRPSGAAATATPTPGAGTPTPTASASTTPTASSTPTAGAPSGSPTPTPVPTATPSASAIVVSPNAFNLPDDPPSQSGCSTSTYVQTVTVSEPGYTGFSVTNPSPSQLTVSPSFGTSFTVTSAAETSSGYISNTPVTLTFTDKSGNVGTATVGLVNQECL